MTYYNHDYFVVFELGQVVEIPVWRSGDGVFFNQFLDETLFHLGYKNYYNPSLQSHTFHPIDRYNRTSFGLGLTICGGQCPGASAP